RRALILFCFTVTCLGCRRSIYNAIFARLTPPDPCGFFDNPMPLTLTAEGPAQSSPRLDVLRPRWPARPVTAVAKSRESTDAALYQGRLRLRLMRTNRS